MNVTRVPCFGGYARILEMADQIRGEVPDTLFLNAGDEFQGTLFFSYYGGEVIAKVLNQGNFSAFTLGNVSTSFPELLFARLTSSLARV